MHACWRSLNDACCVVAAQKSAVCVSHKILSWCIKVATESAVRSPLLLSKVCACCQQSFKDRLRICRAGTTWTSSMPISASDVPTRSQPYTSFHSPGNQICDPMHRKLCEKMCGRVQKPITTRDVSIEEGISIAMSEYKSLW